VPEDFRGREKRRSARPALEPGFERDSRRKGSAEGPDRTEPFAKIGAVDRQSERSEGHHEWGRGGDIDQPGRPIRSEHRPRFGRGRIPAADMSMERRAVAVMALVDRVGAGQDPVPVEERDVIRLARVGMPAKQMVMKLTDLPGLVMMPDVMEIRLRPGRMDNTEDQKNDPHGPASRMMVRPSSHRFAWNLQERKQDRVHNFLLWSPTRPRQAGGILPLGRSI
jgi:hypothetical protein